MEQNIQALIDKYLAGRCTPEEEKAVHDWLEQVDRQGREWPGWPRDKQKDYLSSLYGDIRDSLREREKPVRRRIFRLYLLRAAASLAILACISLLVYYGTGRPGLEQPPGYVLAETPAGNVREIHLNDGSVVWLNAASSFSYPREFSDGTREVFLEGEAFFSVARDTTRPFIIHTAEMETRVLGTSFNVKAYRDSEDMEVTVVSGEVEVSVPSAGTGKEAILLQPNQMATYTRAEGLLNKTSIGDVAPYEEWKEGKLVFNLASMEEVAATLERAFGLNIKIENTAILDCKITGRFSRSQSVDLTIEAICKSIGARYTIRHDKVTIAGEGCEN